MATKRKNKGPLCAVVNELSKVVDSILLGQCSVEVTQEPINIGRMVWAASIPPEIVDGKAVYDYFALMFPEGKEGKAYIVRSGFDGIGLPSGDSVELTSLDFMLDNWRTSNQTGYAGLVFRPTSSTERTIEEPVMIDEDNGSKTVAYRKERDITIRGVIGLSKEEGMDLIYQKGAFDVSRALDKELQTIKTASSQKIVGLIQKQHCALPTVIRETLSHAAYSESVRKKLLGIDDMVNGEILNAEDPFNELCGEVANAIIRGGYEGSEREIRRVYNLALTGTQQKILSAHVFLTGVKGALPSRRETYNEQKATFSGRIE